VQPGKGPRRKAARHVKHSEHQYDTRDLRTVRQQAQDLTAETEAMLARQAWLDRPEAHMLGILLLGCPNVDIITLEDKPGA
jgi:hypothetical protein